MLDGAQNPVVALVVNGAWRYFEVGRVEVHDDADVCIFDVLTQGADPPWTSILLGVCPDVRSSLSYGLWGYPEDAVYELQQHGLALTRPDLIFSQGHVRRGLDGVPVPSIRGSHLMEPVRSRAPAAPGVRS